MLPSQCSAQTVHNVRYDFFPDTDGYLIVARKHGPY